MNPLTSSIQTDLLLPLILMLSQGVLGAWDTLYYHEWRYRLCAHPEHSRRELILHGARDLIYALLFITLPRWSFEGAWAIVLSLLLLSEVIITLMDFVIEREVRAPWGGLAAGELVMHALMAILYGAFLLSLTPHLIHWFYAESSIVAHDPAVPLWILYTSSLMGVGVGLAGARDLGVAFGVPALRWPWRGESRL